MKSCPQGGTTPGTSTGCKQPAGNQLCRKGPGGPEGQDKPWDSACLAAKASSTRGWVRYSITCRLRVESLLCCPVLARQIWSAGSCAGSPRPRKGGCTGGSPAKGHWGDWGSVCPVRRGWQTWGYATLSREGSEGNLTKCINSWWEEIKTTEPDCSEQSPAKGQETTGTSWSGILFKKKKKAGWQLFLFQFCCCEDVCLDSLWNIHPGKCKINFVGHSPKQPALLDPALTWKDSPDQ